ncbi:hypothetical protein FOE78_20785 [Microlunatus elymi]|uniref:Capsular polysaccharide biosynthesis protein n=1 Tax=Microlunatus elymi TaxID=2596828 RepID=A0A516Q3M2_9ACTN|nr:hypothetical protein [Microlunatus elymi]QDP98008.1 hypothetical protein FOE78_20785 [Microlunatus elymi]
MSWLRTTLEAVKLYWRTFALLTLVGLGVSAVAVSATSPVYQSSVVFYVGSKSAPTERPQVAQAYVTSRVQSYVALMNSGRLVQAVKRRDEVDASTADIAAAINATTPDRASMISVVVRSSSANESLAIAQGLAVEFPALAGDLENAGTRSILRVSVLSPPELDPFPAAPHRLRWLGIGLAGGLVLGFAAVLIRRVLGQSVRDGQEVEALLGVPVLETLEMTGRSTEDLRQAAAAVAAIGKRQQLDVLGVIEMERHNNYGGVAGGLVLRLQQRGQPTRLTGAATFNLAGSQETMPIDRRADGSRLTVVEASFARGPAEAMLVAGRCDAVIIVADLGRTSSSQLMEVRQNLLIVRALLVGCVLRKTG